MSNVETKLKVTDFLQCSLRLLYYITAKGCGQTSPNADADADDLDDENAATLDEKIAAVRS